MAPSLDDLPPESLRLLLNGLPLLSGAFWGPEDAWCQEMWQAASDHELEKLGELAGEESASRTITDYLKGLRDSKQVCETLEEAYVRLFISTRGSITASLQHSAYESEDGRLMGRPVKMMTSRLKAVGLELPKDTAVPEDHLAVEIEYLTLLLQGAFGADGKDFLARARDFARTELEPFLERLTQKLQRETESPFYPALARLLLGLVSLVAGGKH